MNKNSASFGSLEIKCIRPRDSQLQCGTGLQACWNRRVCQWSPIWKMLPSPRHPLLASSAGPPIHQTDRSGKRSDVCNNKKVGDSCFRRFSQIVLHKMPCNIFTLAQIPKPTELQALSWIFELWEGSSESPSTEVISRASAILRFSTWKLLLLHSKKMSYAVGPL